MSALQQARFAQRKVIRSQDGTMMADEYRQMQHGGNEARRLLDERLAREEMGDAAYDKMVSQADNRAFKVFGFVFIVVFGVVVLAVTWLGY